MKELQENILAIIDLAITIQGNFQLRVVKKKPGEEDIEEEVQETDIEKEVQEEDILALIQGKEEGDMIDTEMTIEIDQEIDIMIIIDHTEIDQDQDLEEEDKYI